MKRALTTLATLTLLAGCGGNLDQQEARERATETRCDRLEQCGEVAAGKRYVDRDDCEVRVAAEWNQLWSKETCDGNVREEDLDACLNALSSSPCGDGLDYLNTLRTRCSEASVCAGDTED